MEVSVDTPWQSTVARYLSSAGKLNHSSRPHLWTQTQLTKTNFLRVISRNDKPKYQFGRCGHLPTLWYNLQVLGLLLTAISQYKTIATLFGGTINVKSWYIQLSEAALAQASAEIPDAEIGFQNLSERRLWSDQGVTREAILPVLFSCHWVFILLAVLLLLNCFRATGLSPCVLFWFKLLDHCEFHLVFFCRRLYCQHLNPRLFHNMNLLLGWVTFDSWALRSLVPIGAHVALPTVDDAKIHGCFTEWFSCQVDGTWFFGFEIFVMLICCLLQWAPSRADCRGPGALVLRFDKF